MKHVIWTNEGDEVNAIAEDLRNENPDLSEEEAWADACDVIEDYLADERDNLNIDVGSEIIVFADLGLWDGRYAACRLLGSRNLKDCLLAASGDYVTWFVEDGEVKVDDTHHDGTNHLTYRAWKDDVSEDNRGVLLYIIKHGEGKARENLRKWIDKFTRPLGDYVSRVYGWG